MHVCMYRYEKALERGDLTSCNHTKVSYLSSEHLHEPAQVKMKLLLDHQLILC